MPVCIIPLLWPNDGANMQVGLSDPRTNLKPYTFQFPFIQLNLFVTDSSKHLDNQYSMRKQM